MCYKLQCVNRAWGFKTLLLSCYLEYPCFKTWSRKSSTYWCQHSFLIKFKFECLKVTLTLINTPKLWYVWTDTDLTIKVSKDIVKVHNMLWFYYNQAFPEISKWNFVDLAYLAEMMRLDAFPTKKTCETKDYEIDYYRNWNKKKTFNKIEKWWILAY